MQRWIADLKRAYRSEPALIQRDFSNEGFEWVDVHDGEASIVSHLRYASDRRDCVLVVCNLTPVPRANYRVGMPHSGYWKGLLNSARHFKAAAARAILRR